MPINFLTYRCLTSILTMNNFQNSHMMSVDGGSKLLIYGGYDGITTQDVIWMFSMADKSWSILGTMTLPRDDHFVLPVNGYTC